MKLQATISAGITLITLVGCAHRSGAAIKRGEYAVPLTAVTELTPAQYYGLTNIFYEPTAGAFRDSVRAPTGWTNIELDNLFADPELRPIRIMRYHASADTTPRFAVDTVGDLDFTKAPTLKFEPAGKLLIANIDLTVQSRAGTKRRMPFQIARAEKNYVYARIAQKHSGVLKVDGRSYAVLVRHRSRGHPFFSNAGGTEFYIDLNADGVFAERAALTVNGHIAAAEQALPDTPFELAGKLYEISAIDSAGTVLHIRPSERTTAIAPNQRAPQFRATRVSGDAVRITQAKGQFLLFSFWATDCPFSDQVRVAENALVEKYGERLAWIAMAKDTSAADISAYLAKSPMRATVTKQDSATWSVYNPLGATPRFVVVDDKGIVRFQTEGASSMNVLEAKLEELMRFSTPSATPPESPQSHRSDGTPVARW